MNALQHRQTIAPHCNGVLRLSGLRSPYFQTTGTRKEAPGRDIKLSLLTMMYVYGVSIDSSSDDSNAKFNFFATIIGVGNTNGSLNIGLPVVGYPLAKVLRASLVSWANTNFNLSLTNSDIIFDSLGLPLPDYSFTNPSRSLNSAFQISTNRDALAFYSVSIPMNLSLSGGQLGSVVLEYADDSGISTNVVTVGTVTNGNTGTLTIGLNTVASLGCQISGVIPAGKYVRIRPVDTTGTPTQAFVSAQEVLI